MRMTDPSMTSTAPPVATNATMPPVFGPAVWTPAHYFQGIHDPSSFAWLNGLRPSAEGQPSQGSKCFGMDAVYLPMDALLWFPKEMVLAIPFLKAPPVEYFFVCNSGGQRWWCFVVLHKQAHRATAVVFDVDPSVLLIAGLGLRETEVDQKGVRRGRDFAYAPNAAVLCPADRKPVRFERLNPAMREYFRVEEAPQAPAGAGESSTIANLLGMGGLPPQRAEMRVAIGTATLGLQMRINEDEALMRYLDSLVDGEGVGGAS